MAVSGTYELFAVKYASHDPLVMDQHPTVFDDLSGVAVCLDEAPEKGG